MYSIQKSSQITFISNNYSEVKGSSTCELILGDEYGYIRVIDISQFVEENDIKPVVP